jgi:carboxymethylenebutenolidase
MQKVSFPTSRGTATGHLAFPSGEAKAGALIVIHEWWGINAETLGKAEKFAQEGFVALALDIFDGQSTTEPARAAELATQMKSENAIEDIRGAAAFLAQHPRSNGKIGITGFCLGGGVTVAAAFHVEGLAAALAFYGNPRKDLVDFKKKTPPIQGHYAKTDHFADPARAEEIAAGVNAAGGSFEVFVYDAGHAFMRTGDPAAYHAPSAELAWSRALPFLRAHLA